MVPQVHLCGVPSKPPDENLGVSPPRTAGSGGARRRRRLFLLCPLRTGLDPRLRHLCRALGACPLAAPGIPTALCVGGGRRRLFTLSAAAALAMQRRSVKPVRRRIRSRHLNAVVW